MKIDFLFQNISFDDCKSLFLFFEKNAQKTTEFRGCIFLGSERNERVNVFFLVSYQYNFFGNSSEK